MKRNGPEGISARVQAVGGVEFLVLVGLIYGISHLLGVRPGAGGWEQLAWALGAGAAGSLAIGYTGGYRAGVVFQQRSEFARICVAMTAMATLCWALGRQGLFSSPISTVLPWALAVPALLVVRAGLFRLFRTQQARRRILLLGSGRLACRIASRLRWYENLGIELAGLLVEDPEDPPAWTEQYEVLGAIEDAEKQISEPFDFIVVACDPRDPAFPAAALSTAKLCGHHVVSGLQFDEDLSQSLHLEDAYASELPFSQGFRASAIYAAAHRAVDIAIAGSALLVTGPVIGLAALAVRLDSPGSVFYRQARMGRHGQIFRLWKLRSMQPNAERGTGAVWTRGADDLRITRVGRILRPTRIDELPQLWNVLKGDMSLVGPRPERPEFLEELQARYPHFQLRHVVRPGITGWAQTRFGYVNAIDDWEHKLAFDLFYVKHRSIWLDLKILLATPKTLLRLRGM